MDMWCDCFFFDIVDITIFSLRNSCSIKNKSRNRPLFWAGVQQGRSGWASTRPAVCAFSGVDGVRVDRETVGCVSR